MKTFQKIGKIEIKKENCLIFFLLIMKNFDRIIYLYLNFVEII